MNLSRVIIGTLIFVGTIMAQQARSVNLQWEYSDRTGITFNVYRFDGPCPTSGVAPNPLTKLNTAPITELSYSDTTVVTGGKYCYAATAEANGLESVYSNTAEALLLPKPPGKLQSIVVTLQITVEPKE